MGQHCYLRMDQGLIGGRTYTRLKDITMGPIPELYTEPALADIDGKVGFDTFVNDNYGAAKTVMDLLRFLHERYFPRLSWSGLTFSPLKTVFCTLYGG